MWTYLFLAIMPPPAASTGSDAPLASQPVVAAETDAKNQFQGQIESLASGVFAERERATTQLFRAGLTAMPHLEPALQSTNVEVRSRSLRIFAEWLNSSDEQLAAAAEAVLERAANSRAAVAISARARIDANQLHREGSLLAEMERRVPLNRLALT